MRIGTSNKNYFVMTGNYELFSNFMKIIGYNNEDRISRIYIRMLKDFIRGNVLEWINSIDKRVVYYRYNYYFIKDIEYMVQIIFLKIPDYIDDTCNWWDAKSTFLNYFYIFISTLITSFFFKRYFNEYRIQSKLSVKPWGTSRIFVNNLILVYNLFFKKDIEHNLISIYFATFI